MVKKAGGESVIWENHWGFIVYFSDKRDWAVFSFLVGETLNPFLILITVHSQTKWTRPFSTYPTGGRGKLSYGTASHIIMGKHDVW